MGFQVGLVGIFIAFEAWSLHNHLQDAFHILVKNGHIQHTVLNGLYDGFVLFGQTGLQHVVSCIHLCHGILAAKPVGHYHTLEAPFVTEQCGL